MIPILLALAFIAILFIVVITGQPDEFKVLRSATMAAPTEKVFPRVNDFHNWEVWSPWAKMDPACKNTFGGSSAGTGAALSWAGNRKVGEGRMTILESRPGELIRIKLEFLKPLKATNVAEFTFKPEGGQTVVTWIMSGENNFPGKVFGLIMNFDKTVGGDFEKGLAAMKSVVEDAGKN